MKTKFLILFMTITMFLSACGNATADYIEFNGEKYRKNEELMLGFSLPEGYNFKPKEEITLYNMQMTASLALSSNKLRIHEIVTLDENSDLCAVFVIEIDADAEKMETFAKEVVFKHFAKTDASNISEKEKRVTFCEKDVICTEFSYVFNNKAEYILSYTGILNNCQVCIITWGTTSDEAKMLMESFYKTEN